MSRRRGRGQGNRRGGFGRANRKSLSSSTRGSSKSARTARRNSRLNAKRGTSRTGKLKINVNARRAAKHLSNSRVAKALGLSGIGNRITKRIPKSWKVRANLKTAIKSKIGEKNYRQTSANNPGSGRRLTDQQIADYDFYSKYNPQGITVSQAKKMYANQLKEGATLEQAMRSNKAETTFFDALIPDREEPVRSIRSKTPGGLGRIRRIPKPRAIRGIPDRGRPPRGGPEPDAIAMMYENILGRKADQGGLDYWKDELSSGRQNLEAIRRNFVRSKEFQGRSDADKRSALRGIKQRRAARGEKVGVSRIVEELDRRGIRHSNTGPKRLPPRFWGTHAHTRDGKVRNLRKTLAATMAARGI
tara:strand:+ start:106 stop:1185 length:1080 start_codon:yes stop_codon:yes gene_type:complete